LKTQTFSQYSGLDGVRHSNDPAVFDNLDKGLNFVEEHSINILAHIYSCSRMEIRGQYHRRFTSSFYALIPKAEKYSQFVSLFALLGSASVKAACRLIKLTQDVAYRAPKQVVWFAPLNIFYQTK